MGGVMADLDPGRIGQQLRFEGIGNILKRSERGAETAIVDGRRVRVCYASAPGFETYRTGIACCCGRWTERSRPGLRVPPRILTTFG